MKLNKKTIITLLIIITLPPNNIKADAADIFMGVLTATTGFAVVTVGSILAARATNGIIDRMEEKYPSFFNQQNQRALEKQEYLEHRKKKLVKQYAIAEQSILKLNEELEKKAAECQKNNISFESSPEIMALAQSFQEQKSKIEQIAQAIQAHDEALASVEKAMQSINSAQQQDKAETTMTTVTGTLQLGSEILFKLQQLTRPTL
ncbi:MAG: hypothetical protein WC707_03650 [Candidatus Babeliaceae bacterium]|jgi:hypothetical protein